MKKILLLISVCFSMQTFAQSVNIAYKESFEDIINPERGFYIPIGTTSSKFILLDEKKLKTYRKQPQQLNGAKYKVNVSLIYRAYELDIFKDKPLSKTFLENLQKDFDITRAAGLKMILRFAYTNTTHGGDCKDEYKICPPYGDAPRDIVMQHVAQLKPFFQKNADVIALLQQGFIGIWGENYFTDFFGCATNDGAGVITDSGWIDRNKFLKSLLDALPKDRMVQVRTPQIKQRFVYGINAPVNAKPLLLKETFTASDKVRIGFHNDCFLSSEDDYGTFYSYGNSSSKRDTANIQLRKYFEADSKYVAVGGETCDDAFSPQNDCGPIGNAEKEMAAMHYSYLNAAYNNDVNNDWDSLGCMKSIKNKLGYRFVMQKALLPKIITKGKSFEIKIEIKNTGYAAPFNPRQVQLILRNKASGKIVSFTCKTKIQKWFTGKIFLNENFIPSINMESGEYEMLLNLPDNYKSLQNNSMFSIRFANENTWEENTGYNLLNQIVKIN